MTTLRLAFSALLAVACGDDGPSTPTGPCRAPLETAWPSDDDPQICHHAVDPTYPTQRTPCDLIIEDCDATGTLAPDLDCLTTPGVDPPGPATVTVVGYADVFSNGTTSQNARIEFFRLADIPDAVTSLDDVTPIGSVDLVLDDTTVATARACPRDQDEPEVLAGECVTPDADCAACPVAANAVDFCYQGACHELQRWEVEYAIADVPTNTPLVVRSIGLTGGDPDPAHQIWAPVVQYNVYLSTGDRACAGDASFADNNCNDAAAAVPTYRFNANLLSRSDYENIPVTAGITSGITPGNGAVAGEVHDCDDIRLEHAQVGYDRSPRKVIYFNQNPAKTLPDLSRFDRGTSQLSLYSGLDLEPGPIRIEALGSVGGELVQLGGFSAARIWPDTVTIIGINGGKRVVE